MEFTHHLRVREEAVLPCLYTHQQAARLAVFLGTFAVVVVAFLPPQLDRLVFDLCSDL